jgi:hypothetical protein
MHGNSKFIPIIIFVLILMPTFAHAQTQNGSGGLPSIVPNSGMAKDYFGTILNKLQSSSQQSGLANSQFSNVTSSAKKATMSAIDLFSAVKYVIASIMGWIAPTILGYGLPNWAIPVLVWGMLGLTIYFVFRHIWKIVVVGLIIILLIFLFLLYGSGLIPHS